MYEPLFIVVVVECYGGHGRGGRHMTSLSVKKIINRVK